MKSIHRYALLTVGALTLGACDDSPTNRSDRFLDGEVALVVNSTEQALSLVSLDDPTKLRQVPFGAQKEISPTGVSVRGTRAVVPLGGAASVALIDLEAQRIDRFFTFPSGNATGSAWVDDNAVLVANLNDGYVGRFTLDQAGSAITKKSAPLVQGPTDIEMVGSRALVVSSNYDYEAEYPLGFQQGTVTALDPVSLNVLGTVAVGINPTDAVVGTDGELYVLNTGNYSDPSTISVVDPATLRVTSTVEGLPAGSVALSTDRSGRLFISSFFAGTVVWDSGSRTFVRGTDDPVCAKTAEGACRGAFDAVTDAEGNLYQTFFGSARREVKPWVFKYRASDYQLVDSISAGSGFYGPTAIEIRQF